MGDVDLMHTENRLKKIFYFWKLNTFKGRENKVKVEIVSKLSHFV